MVQQLWPTSHQLTLVLNNPYIPEDSYNDSQPIMAYMYVFEYTPQANALCMR